jgi:hypothetical protein
VGTKRSYRAVNSGLYNDTMNNADLDKAIDFAEGYQNTYPFCKKMAIHFNRLGYLTSSQVQTLLSIKKEHGLKARF